MARIIYGVAGEGSGHSSRAKIIIEHLIAHGHDVRILSHDHGYANLSKYFPVEKITGLNLIYKNNEVQYITTALKTLGKIPGATKSINTILALIDSFHPDILITDFEPLTALGANIRGIPLLSIDNQHIITGTAIETPSRFNKEKLIVKNVVRYIVPPADAYFVTTFFYPTITNRKTKLFPPILRNEVLSLTPTNGDYFLVYTTAENKNLIQILEKSNIPCVVYGASKPTGKSTQVVYKPHDQAGFLTDLSGARGIIATAGFSLISEALYLHKPYLALPVEKQYEQILNAYYLKKIGVGDYSLAITHEDIKRFNKRIDWYVENLQKLSFKDNHKILAAIDLFIANALS